MAAVERSRKGLTAPKTKQYLMRNSVSRESTLDFFRRVLDDETEAALMRMFMTGYGPKLDEKGNPILTEDKQFIMEKVELNAISLKMFLRAQEYKRGMPIQIVRTPDGEKEQTVTITVIGATADFFEEQAKAKGLLVGSK